MGEGSVPSATVQKLIDTLQLQRHPEGGWYRETWRDTTDDGSRGHGTAIYFLLEEGPGSLRHRVDATELWHHYAGDPVELRIESADGHVVCKLLGSDLVSGERPQEIVPKDAWQSARSTGAWSLVGCTVCPAFEFSGFELSK